MAALVLLAAHREALEIGRTIVELMLKDKRGEQIDYAAYEKSGRADVVSIPVDPHLENLLLGNRRERHAQ